jgi:hypothetical protein
MKMKYFTIVIFLLFFDTLSFSQSIRSYFTQSVDNSVSGITDAQMSPALDDTIKKFIEQSQTTLDIAVWDNGSAVIVGAINDAYTRGVQVRYITSSNALNSALSGLNSNIPVLERNSGLTSNVMHNKFIIVDGQQILTGSMNFGNGSMFDDYNNIVIIEDPSLASTYTVEFEEMWGGNGAQPNLANSKFGPDKSNNTFHSFLVGSTIVESYFSPTDNTTAEIVNAINSADHELDIAMFTFINNDIGDAVIAAKNRGVYVRCIIENVSYFGSEYNGLVNAGITVLSHESVNFDFHHKYCIIDAQHASSDPQVITGSHNWTNSAEEEYDENTLIIHDHIIAQQYTEEFFRRWTELGGASLNEIAVEPSFYIYPNPSTGNITITGDLKEVTEINILNSSGQIIRKGQLEMKVNSFSLDLLPGAYFIQLISTDSVSTQKFIVE